MFKSMSNSKCCDLILNEYINSSPSKCDMKREKQKKITKLFENYKNGFFAMNDNDFLEVINQRYPEAKFNFDHDYASYKLSLDQFLKCFQSEFKYDIIYTGGLYTNYNINTPFAQAHPDIFYTINRHKNADLFVQAIDATEHEKLKQNYFYEKTFGCLAHNLNLNFIFHSFKSHVTEYFDFDFTKIWHCADNNNIMVPPSLIFKDLFINEASFFNDTIYLKHKNYEKTCQCHRQVRVLKYLFKGFYDSITLQKEMDMCRTIFSKKKCSICSKEFAFFDTF